MPLSPYGRMLAAQKRPVAYKTSEAGYEQRIRRVNNGPERELVSGTAEYAKAFKFFNSSPLTILTIQERLAGKKDPNLKGDDYSSTYEDVNTTYSRRGQPASSDARSGPQYDRYKYYSRPIVQERYDVPLSREVTKYYNPVRQRLAYGVSRKRGEFASALTGL